MENLPPKLRRKMLDKLNVSRKERYHNDPEFRQRCLECSRKYYQAHREELLEYGRRYKLKKKEERNERLSQEL